MAMEFRTGLEDKPWYVAAGLGLILGIILYWGANVWLLQPRKESLENEETRLAGLQSKIQEGRAAKLQLPRFREEVQELELELEKLLRILPARRNTPGLLRRIRTLAEQGDFNLIRFTPGGFIDQDFYSEWPISISLEGNYHNLALFFDRVSRFSRVVNIEGLKINGKKSGNSEHTIAASFRAKTFIYKDVDESDAAGGQP